jgi:hypothetical protein
MSGINLVLPQRNYLDEEVIHILLAVFRHAVEFSKNTRTPQLVSRRDVASGAVSYLSFVIETSDALGL